MITNSNLIFNSGNYSIYDQSNITSNSNFEGSVSKESLASIFPEDLVSGKNLTPEVWKGFDQNRIINLVDSLKEERIVSVETQDGQKYNKIAFSSKFEETLYLGQSTQKRKYEGTQELEKARILANAFDETLGKILTNENDKQRIMRKILSNHGLVNRCNSNFMLTFKNSSAISSIISNNPEIWENGFIPFFELVTKNMNSYLDSLNIENNNGITVYYSEAGGAHLSIAKNLESDISKMLSHKPLHLVNETKVLTEDDVLRKATGFPKTQVYNVILQKTRNKEFGNYTRPLFEMLSLYIPSKKISILRKESQRADLIVNVDHHENSYWLVEDETKQKLIYQICDYGVIPDKIENIAKKVIRYNLQNIYFHLPSENSYLKLHPGKFNEKLFNFELRDPQFDKYFKAGTYPVSPAFHQPASEMEKQKLREEFALNPEHDLVILTMGSQGVGGILETYIDQLIEGVLNDPNPKPIEAMVLCGRNDSLITQLNKHIESNLYKLTNSEIEKIKSNLNFKMCGFIPNEKVAILGQMCSMYLTKPGGGTAGENITAKIPTAIHKDKEHPWEFGNVDEMLKHGNLIANDKHLYMIMKELPKTHKPINLNGNMGNLVDFVNKAITCK